MCGGRVGKCIAGNFSAGGSARDNAGCGDEGGSGAGYRSTGTGCADTGKPGAGTRSVFRERSMGWYPGKCTGQAGSLCGKDRRSEGGISKDAVIFTGNSFTYPC